MRSMLYTTYINQAAWKSFRITCIFHTGDSELSR